MKHIKDNLMKKIIPYIIILLLIAANVYTVWFFRQKIQLREAKIADAAVKSSGGSIISIKR